MTQQDEASEISGWNDPEDPEETWIQYVDQFGDPVRIPMHQYRDEDRV
jgi:hypothetical protein